jgi:hypothetical protein
MAANNRDDQEIAFLAFEHVANLYSLYQYAFSAKGVFRERVIGQNSVGRFPGSNAAFLWTYQANTASSN